MRYSPEHKQATRQRILKAAADQFRERGFSDTGVASIMEAADLTHGGFYAHFESKDHLIAEVIRAKFDDVSAKFESRFAGLPDQDWLAAWVRGYLSGEHQSHTAQGCPLPALSPEIARSGPEARTAFTELFHERLAVVASKVDASRDEAERRVLAALSQMAGALMLARATDEPLSTRIREAAAERAIATLTAPAAQPAGAAS